MERKEDISQVKVFFIEVKLEADDYKLVLDLFFDIWRVDNDFKNVTLHPLPCTNFKNAVIIDVLFELNDQILDLPHILLPLVFGMNKKKSLDEAGRSQFHFHQVYVPVFISRDCP